MCNWTLRYELIHSLRFACDLSLPGVPCCAQLLIEKLQREIKELKKELAMHDTLGMPQDQIASCCVER